MTRLSWLKAKRQSCLTMISEDRNSDLPKIREEHIRALLKLLHKHATHFLVDQVPQSESSDSKASPLRIYFVDSDILASYVNGIVRNHWGEWASLLSLAKGARQRARAVNDSTVFFNNIVNQAVSRYIMNVFSRSLVSQRGCLYITPEHLREFDGVAYSVAQGVADTGLVPDGWMESLEEEYVKLCQVTAGSAGEEPLKHASRIAKLLIESAPTGAVSRAYSARSKGVSKLSAHMVIPPGEGNRAFILDTRFAGWDALVRKRVVLAELLFLNNLRDLNPSSERYFDIKRQAIQEHNPEKSLAQRFRSLLTNPILAAKFDPITLQSQARIAITQVADIYSLARLGAVAELLQKEHKLANNQNWEVCLLTGSSVVGSLRNSWPTTDKAMQAVQIIHPLSMLRQSDLYDPDGAKVVAQRLNEPLEDEYALELIMGRNIDDSDPKPIDASAFCTSLRKILGGVVARSAEESDPSLNQLRLLLRDDSHFDQAAYISAVREGIGGYFYNAFVSINELGIATKAALPVASLPSLCLPIKEQKEHSAADRFFVELHNDVHTAHTASGVWGFLTSRVNPRSTPIKEPDMALKLLGEVRKQDKSGYSAMLCAAVAYIAKGKSWLGAADTMASTATMLALGRVGERLPQGNEALYLKAFLMRMRFDPVKQAVQQLYSHHERLMDAADTTLKQWCSEEPELANEPIFLDSSEVSRYDLLVLRYQAERSAGLLFSVMPCTFDSNEFAIDLPNKERLIKLTVDARTALIKCLAFSKNRPREIHQPAHAFVLAQVWAMAIQAWFTVHLIQNRDPQILDFSTIAEAQNLLASDISSSIDALMQATPESGLVRVLAEVFSVVQRKKERGVFGVTEQDFNHVSFALIDQYRMPLLKKAWGA